LEEEEMEETEEIMAAAAVVVAQNFLCPSLMPVLLDREAMEAEAED
jgi:hypothetical protein